MKSTARLSLSTLALAMFFLVPAAFAQSASGGFQVKNDDGILSIEFSAQAFSNGRASGDLKLTTPISIPDQDVDGDKTGDPSTEGTTLSLRVDVDCMRVQDNRAVLGGLIRESSVDTYIGRRLLLTVEDGAAGKEGEPDRFTWGQYRQTEPTWVASDAELKFDEGVGLKWVATDAERDDDKGVSAPAPAGIDCQSFSLASFELQDLPKEGGDIMVKP
jgi:hypothetical protein